MELKPDFKKTEIGVIPRDWESVDYITVGQIIDGDRGGQYPSNGDLRSDGYCLFLNAGNVTKSGFRFADCQFITVGKDRKLNKGKLTRGDVVLTTRGTLGNFSYFDNSVPYEHVRINSGMVILRNVSPKIIGSYQYLVLRSNIVASQIARLSFGSAQPQLTVKGIATLKIPLPPTKAEQEAIAEALGDADALIESLEQLVAKERQLKQGAMQELLTGRRRLPGFSGKWQVKTLGDLFTFSGGYSASRDQLSSEGHCYLHYGDIHGSSKTFVDTRADYPDIPKLDIPLKRISSSSLLKDGDVVFVDASEDDEGASKHVVVVNKDNVPFISGLHTIVAKSTTGEIANEYRRYCFQTTSIRQQFLFYAVGMKVSGISKSNIPKLTLPVPPVPEQLAIATILSDMDLEMATLEAKLNKTRQLKQGMMQELLIGKIRLV
jgi:type I restriction enzyme S subunit